MNTASAFIARRDSFPKWLVSKTIRMGLDVHEEQEDTETDNYNEEMRAKTGKVHEDRSTAVIGDLWNYRLTFCGREWNSAAHGGQYCWTVSTCRRVETDPVADCTAVCQSEAAYLSMGYFQDIPPPIRPPDYDYFTWKHIVAPLLALTSPDTNFMSLTVLTSK